MKTLLLFMLFVLMWTGIQMKPIQIKDVDEQIVQIEIRGHVRYPGIYDVKRGSTLQDVLNLAKPFDDSELRWINLLSPVHDQDVLTIVPKSEELVLLNSASLEELCTLPGIGEKTAQKIIDYRNEHLFQKIEQLLEVTGIGEKKFEALKGKIGL